MDFSAFTFFVACFRNPDSLDAHAHEDFLSYVVYCGTEELVVDPGRPSFSPDSAVLLSAPAHNGLTDAEDALSPLRRYFFNRRLRSEPRAIGREKTPSGGVRLWAVNTLFGLRRELTIEESGDGVRVEETLAREARPLAARFGHLFAGMDATLNGGEVAVRDAGCRLIYEIPADRLSVVTASRSPTYGHRAPCRRLTVDFGTDRERVASVRWRIAKAG